MAYLVLLLQTLLNKIAAESGLSIPAGQVPYILSRLCFLNPVLRIRDVYDPDFYPSRIPDRKTATTERGEKNLLSYLFLEP